MSFDRFGRDLDDSGYFDSYSYEQKLDRERSQRDRIGLRGYNNDNSKVEELESKITKLQRIIIGLKNKIDELENPVIDVSNIYEDLKK